MAELRAVIYTFVNAVFVHDDKLLLNFNFKDGTRTITLTDAKIAVKKNTGSNLDCSVAPCRSKLCKACSDFFAKNQRAHSPRALCIVRDNFLIYI